MEFGELKTSDIFNIEKSKLERLFIVNMRDHYDQLPMLKKLNNIRYNLSTVNTTETLILY